MEPINRILDDDDKLEPARQMQSENDSAMPGAELVEGLRLYSLKQLMAQQFPSAAWIAEGLIPEGITIMSAQPASFKTWLLLSTAVSVASGQLLFEQLETSQANVLIIDEENGARLLQQRLRLLYPDDQLPIHFMIESNFKLDATQISKVIKICKEYEVRLVMFDSLVRIHGSNENDATAMAQVFSGLRRFTKAGISVLLTHHNRKTQSENGALDMRGSSDILAAVDCHVSVKRDQDNRLLLTQTKLRIAPEGDPIELQVITDDDSVRLEYIGTVKPSESKKKRTTAAIVELLDQNGEVNKQELQSLLSDMGFRASPKTLKQYLDTLLESDTITVLPGAGNEKRYQIKV